MTKGKTGMTFLCYTPPTQIAAGLPGLRNDIEDKEPKVKN
jgi:hypothetical protein